MSLENKGEIIHTLEKMDSKERRSTHLKRGVGSEPYRRQTTRKAEKWVLGRGWTVKRENNLMSEDVYGHLFLKGL